MGAFSVWIIKILEKISGSGCLKLTKSLVNISLKFQTLICVIRQYFLLKNCEKLLHLEAFAVQKLLSLFFNKKCHCIWL